MKILFQNSRPQFVSCLLFAFLPKYFSWEGNGLTAHVQSPRGNMWPGTKALGPTIRSFSVKSGKWTNLLDDKQLLETQTAL